MNCTCLVPGLLSILVLLCTPVTGVSAQPARKKLEPPVEMEIPKSFFNIPATARDGRNPFFPESNAGKPLKNVPPTADVSALVLNGITSLPKRTAMVNGRTFEVGESGDVKLKNGARLVIEMLEIKDDSAVILVLGQRREIRLRAGL